MKQEVKQALKKAGINKKTPGVSHLLKARNAAKKAVRKQKYGEDIIIVSGLPRSGTSMMMKMLDAAGFSIMTDEIREADEDNPKGYFEFERVKDLEKEDDKTWVKDARGKVLKVISFLLKDLPPENSYRVIFMRRDIDEIIASQNKMIQRRQSDDNTDDQEIKAYFERHLFQVKNLIAKGKNFDSVEIAYLDAINDPAKVAAQVNEFLGGDLDEELMASVVERKLYRNRKGDLK